MSKKRVFISHNPYIGQYVAHRIFHELRLHNVRVYLIQEDRSFTTPLPNPIYDEWLTASDVFVAILTPAIFTRPYANDGWFWREVEMALANQLSIIAVRTYGFRFPLTPPWQASLTEQLKLRPSIWLTDKDVEASLRSLMLQINSAANKDDNRRSISPKDTRYAELLLDMLDKTPLPTTQQITAEKLLNHATIVANFGDYAADEEECTLALEQHPTYISARLNRASAHALQGHHHDAFEDVNWCIEHDSTNFRHYNNRGNVYTMTRNFDMALLDYSKAIDLNPRSDYQYNNRGFTRYQIGDYTGAVQDCTTAIHINPESFDAYDSRGLAYFCLGDYENALKDFQTVQNIRPELIESLAGLAITHFVLDNFAAARTAWENLVAIIGVDDLEFLQKRFLWNAIVFEAIELLVESLMRIP